MISRRVLAILVAAVPLLIVSFGVTMVGYLLTQAADDALGSAVLRRIGCGVLMLLAVDMILLVAALGFNALGEHDEDQDRPHS